MANDDALRGLHQITSRTSLLVGGKPKKRKDGNRDHFTILSSSQRKRNFLKVLSPNRNPLEELYRLFPQLPPGETPVNGFTCALHKDILLQGKMIICTNCVCFHSNIFGYETRVIIYFKNVLAIRREKTAFVVPNAISIRTLHKRYFFCSFLSRESVYKLLSTIWKTATLKTDDDLTNDDTKHRKTSLRGEKNTFDLNNNFFCHDLSTLDCSLDSSLYIHEFEFPDRPHTSPPTLNNISLGDDTILYESSKINQQTMHETITESGSDIEAETELNIEKCTRSYSFADIRELEKMQLQLGTEKLLKIERQIQEAFLSHTLLKEKEDCKLERHFLIRMFEYLKSDDFRYILFWVMIFLIMLMVVIAISLIIQINLLSASIQNLQTFPSIPLSTTMKESISHEENIIRARVYRVKSILMANLKTVDMIDDMLQSLGSNL